MTGRDSEAIDANYNPDVTWPDAGIGELDFVLPERERDFLYDLRAQRGDNPECAPEKKAHFRGYHWKARDHELPPENLQYTSEYNYLPMGDLRYWEPKDGPEYNLQLVPTINYENFDPHYKPEDIILLQHGLP